MKLTPESHTHSMCLTVLLGLIEDLTMIIVIAPFPHTKYMM